MRLLDRTIARQFLVNVALLFVLLFSIIVVVDFAFNFDEYTRQASEMASDGGRVRQVLVSVLLVLDLWWPRFFQLYNFLLGLVIIGAMGFTLAQMVRHRELVAAISSGISLHRIARPIIIAAAILTLLQAANRELLIPRLATLLTREKWDAGKRSLAADALKLGSDAKGRLWYAVRFNPDEQTLEGLYVWERDDRGLLEARITAPKARWEGGAWTLEGGSIDRWEGERMVSTPIDVISSDLDPTTMTLRRFEGFGQYLSTRQLTQLVDRYGEEKASRERIDSLDRIRYGRVAVMLANMLSLLVCLPFFLRREPTNMLVQSVYCAPVAIVAVMGSTLGATAAIPGLPPIIGAFVPVMVLTCLAIAAMSSVRT